MITEDEVAHFLDESAMLGTTESFALFAPRSSLFRILRSRINSATIVGQDIEDFVERILKDYQVGRTFYADRILALVAQLVSGGPEPFASRYLRELASLKSAELPLSPRVARRVLRQREVSFSQTSVSEREFSDRLYSELGTDYSSTVLPCDDACPRLVGRHISDIDLDRLMARLELFLVAESVSVDQTTNRVSVFEVLEQVPLKVGNAKAIPHCVAFSLWRMEEDDGGRDFQVLLRVHRADGVKPDEVPTNFTAHSRRHRVFTHMRGLPLGESGELRFEVLLNGTHQAEHVVTVIDEGRDE